MDDSRSGLRWAFYLLVGGGGFWVTDALFVLLGGIVPTRLWIVAKTLALPLGTYLTVRAMTRRGGPKRLPASGPYLMLAGIWLMGPVYSLIVNKIYVKSAMGLGESLFHLALFPLSTLVIATYSGALGGLLIASVYLGLAGLFPMYRN